MGQVQVVILDPQGSPKGVELPDDDKVANFLPALIAGLAGVSNLKF